MISYFDTSVILPALHEQHPIHERCKNRLLSARKLGNIYTASTHGYAELYSNLTRLPKVHRLSPEDTVELLYTFLKPQIKLVALNEDDYEIAIRRCAERRIVSGAIYDALHIVAAEKIGANRIYTANMRDFSRLMPKDTSIELIDVLKEPI